MRNSYKLLFIVCLLPLFSIAQNNYRPAIIVNLKGDTLSGFINYIDWVNNPKSVWFKNALSENKVRLTPGDTRFFKVDAGQLAEYIRYAGPLTMDNPDLDHLQIGRDSSVRLDTVFLKVLQKGPKLVLLAYSDDLKTRYFISGPSLNDPKELIYRIYYNSNVANGLDRTVYENTYKSQFYEAGVKANVMTADLKNYIQKADFNEMNMINIASKINGISKADISKNSTARHSPVTKAIGIIAALAVLIVLINDFSNLHH
ncbi:MAG TPA: hypothetical protein VNW95_10375 [Mucilaginibacter sp.]|jgi:hypothetical protein|nr:hypothetical protein [Mucilaginibacter sp.]